MGRSKRTRSLLDFSDWEFLGFVRNTVVASGDGRAGGAIDSFSDLEALIGWTRWVGVKNAACERLLDQRIELKMKSKKLNNYLNRFRVAMPKPRDQKERPPCIPEAVLEAKAKKVEQAAEKQIKLEKDLEVHVYVHEWP
ncbi:nucleolar GTP-binding protein 1 [Forsythia ovata]|uniref:Nucleolar GTP-binding protein 1 n=1 Tax=Forsythia ovata TaxID=205694 RepID=A0ABD1U955_9LAMI